jgi:hypothetical protein
MNPPTYFCVIPRGHNRYTIEGWYREGWCPLLSFTSVRSERRARIRGGFLLREMFAP